ncbi:MAG: TonB-dependent receptor [Steroidobacteraceae bacterium]
MSRCVEVLMKWGVVCSAIAALPIAASAAQSEAAMPPSNPATAQELPQVLVIGNAPLPGLGLPLDYVPSNVQSVTSLDLQRQESLDLADYLNNNFSGVTINESQDNPFQADVNYHGFAASPLLGAPEGLSVYVDGVRVNEAFGDTVNWDLIPESAISTVTLVSGSNPVFGLNTLGGALSVQTKSGHDFPGTELQGYGGSFGRRAFEGETGGSVGRFDYFLTGNSFDETGWRDLSPSHVRQLFGKVGYEDDQTDIDLSYTWADNRLIGNGTTPQSMLDYRSEAIYTAPDFTQNRLNFVNLNATHFLAHDFLLSGNVFYRVLETLTNNGDVNDNNYMSDGYDGPDIDCSVPAASRADSAYCDDGINRADRLGQHTAGGGLQLTATPDVFGVHNQAVGGADYSQARVTYAQSVQYALLTPERLTVADVNPFNDAETVNSVTGTTEIFGAYVTDTLTPLPLLHLTGSLRYNRSVETLGGYSVDTDLGDFGSGWDEPNTIAEDHAFVHLNPALGLTVTPSDALTLYADFNEASRAPTVIELGCSDPEAPCGLPNDFTSDPDLKQVIAHTFEVGARGSLPGGRLDWSIDLFHTVNQNDIQFVATTTSEGYFTNVGDTRRQGLDLAFGGAIEQLKWHLVYSYVDATYQSSFEVNAESNSTADDDGNIQVLPGDRIPLIPRHTGRLVLDYPVTRDWDIGGNLIVSASTFLHGNENNANRPDEDHVIGSGSLGGYAVVNLNSTYHVAKFLDVFVRLVNVFDRRYATAGFLTGNSFDPNGAFRPDPDEWTNENSVSPAQPRTVWAGVRLRLQ